MIDGWVKFHRKIIDWQWYQDPVASRVFFHIVLKANHREQNWKNISISRGQWVTSLQRIAEDLNLGVQQVRTALKKLEKSQNLTCKPTNRFTMITVCNYETYQENNSEGNKQTNNQITNNQQQTRMEECKNNNPKELSLSNLGGISPNLEEVRERVNQLDLKHTDPEEFFRYNSAKGWMIGTTKVQNLDDLLLGWDFKKQNQNTGTTGGKTIVTGRYLSAGEKREKIIENIAKKHNISLDDQENIIEADIKKID